MTDPNADLADIRQKWLAFCSHDTGLPYPCICPTEDHRPVIAALVGEVETLRAEVVRREAVTVQRSRIAHDVAEFHVHIDSPPWSGTLADMPARQVVTRNRLIAEEVSELIAATAAGDLLGIADGLADVVYVAYGTAYTYGVDLDAVLAEVHRSNMTKDSGATGKAVKGERYTPPDIRAVLDSDVAQLTADRDSLIKAGEALAADRDEARTKLARCREDRDEYGGQAAAAEKDAEQLGRRLAEVLIERDEAQALLRLAPHHQQQVVTLEYELVQARAEVVRLTAERDETRDREFDVALMGRQSFDATERADVGVMSAATLGLVSIATGSSGAIEISAEFDDATPAPPSTPESDGQGEVAVTDAVEAPGGAEGGWLVVRPDGALPWAVGDQVDVIEAPILPGTWLVAKLDVAPRRTEDDAISRHASGGWHTGFLPHCCPACGTDEERPGDA